MKTPNKELHIYITGPSHHGIHQFFQAFDFVGKGEKEVKLNTIDFRRHVVSHCIQGIIRLVDIVEDVKEDNEIIPFDITPLIKVLESSKTMQRLHTSIDIKMDPAWKELMTLIQDIWFNPIIQKYNCPPYHEDIHFLSYLIPHMSKFLSVEYIPTINDLYYCPPISPIQMSQFIHNDVNIYLSTWNPPPTLDMNQIQLGNPSIIIIPVLLDNYCFVEPEGNCLLRVISTLKRITTTTDHPFESKGMYIFLIKKHFDELIKRYPLKNCFPEYDGSISEINFIKQQFKFSKPFMTGEVGIIVSNIPDPNSLLKIPRAIYPVIEKEAKLKNEKINVNEEKESFKVFNYQFKESKKVKCITGMISLQGKRPTNEDTEIVKDKIKKDKIKFGLYAVFDGHGGSGTSQAAISVVEEELMKSELMKKKMYEEMMNEIFSKSDKILCNTVYDNSGCTAAVVLVIGRFLICANVGDSEVLVISEGKQYEVLSVQHKAKLPDEKKRITSLGVPVYGGRVYGSLAVSRSLGDKQYKGGRGAVISTPHVKVYEMTKKDKAFVISCDGIYETLNYDDVVDWVITGMKLNKAPTIIAENIAMDALEKGSKDNVSVIVSLLKWK
ncbi:protein phosphatase domain containing protein [Entamoeba histolytica HM-3:IMSS]|uniref:Protein phosphatase domain-containing protein n=6 Tax=Entamoeba histolytica TaxID=5759 RepID=C4LVQ8_ENTH1|nr:protein phosphatase domain-containing protein [Entamoeba histolytica HM-1:IMSS]EAL51044.1 protein phosphatase domain-containing protein [Entamoeba histolytica HM-1:IMSS]EMD49369.1 protein phosphatase domain containing protein [Entamoeba histolytica KU27]EMS12032.1 protein phosphatase domain containing protein [Entamoeba histolytica HM-3:IMSS]GAT92762.1 protein phosphatase domain-containing protein [Entamoeba histolytica]|eukprot:XP_656430.1 protein phosphatase domain-containing protein [Entamoeba histolytica HM-1:IMSS]